MEEQTASRAAGFNARVPSSAKSSNPGIVRSICESGCESIVLRSAVVMSSSSWLTARSRSRQPSGASRRQTAVIPSISGADGASWRLDEALGAVLGDALDRPSGVMEGGEGGTNVASRQSHCSAEKARRVQAVNRC